MSFLAFYHFLKTAFINTKTHRHTHTHTPKQLPAPHHIPEIKVTAISSIHSFKTRHKYNLPFCFFGASLVAQRLKHLPVMRETWVWSLGQKDSPGEGNGNPLQYSCLENPMDGGTWWTTVHGVAESDTTEWLHFHFSLLLFLLAAPILTFLQTALKLDLVVGVLVMASVKGQTLEQSQIRHCLSGIKSQVETKTWNVEGVFVQSWALEAIADQVLPQSFYPWLPPHPHALLAQTSLPQRGQWWLPQTFYLH